jgi:hypothetical protein
VNPVPVSVLKQVGPGASIKNVGPAQRAHERLVEHGKLAADQRIREPAVHVVPETEGMELVLDIPK